jgi:hypothetical protein
VLHRNKRIHSPTVGELVKDAWTTGLIPGVLGLLIIGTVAFAIVRKVLDLYEADRQDSPPITVTAVIHDQGTVFVSDSGSLRYVKLQTPTRVIRHEYSLGAGVIDAMRPGQRLRLTYRVGKSGTIHVDAMDLLSKPAGSRPD